MFGAPPVGHVMDPQFKPVFLGGLWLTLELHPQVGVDPAILPPWNPVFGNFLLALYKEIELILRSFFFLKDFNLILGGSFEIQFLAIF